MRQCKYIDPGMQCSITDESRRHGWEADIATNSCWDHLLGDTSCGGKEQHSIEPINDRLVGSSCSSHKCNTCMAKDTEGQRDTTGCHALLDQPHILEHCATQTPTRLDAGARLPAARLAVVEVATRVGGHDDLVLVLGCCNAPDGSPPTHHHRLIRNSSF